MKNSFYIVLPLLFAVIVIISVMDDIAGSKSVINTSQYLEEIKKMPLAPLPYQPVRDTIYVLGNSYINIDLKLQKAFLFIKDSAVKEFGISSGNPSLDKGIATTRGVFTIQSKSRLAFSKQFENAELHNWLGFNGNIGFHGLKGNGYYRYLGKQASSHGCVRISREDGMQLYNLVQRGTPVIVYYDEPARVFAFADFKEYLNGHSIMIGNHVRTVSDIAKNRLKRLYQGKAYSYPYSKIFFDGSTVLKGGGLEAGFAEKIALKQELPTVEFPIENSLKDVIKSFSDRILILPDSLIDSKKKIKSKN